MKKWTKFIKYVDSAEYFMAINYQSRSEWIKSTSYIYFFIFLYISTRFLCLPDIIISFFPQSSRLVTSSVSVCVCVCTYACCGYKTCT